MDGRVRIGLAGFMASAALAALVTPATGDDDDPDLSPAVAEATHSVPATGGELDDNRGDARLSEDSSYTLTTSIEATINASAPDIAAVEVPQVHRSTESTSTHTTSRVEASATTPESTVTTVQVEVHATPPDPNMVLESQASATAAAGSTSSFASAQSTVTSENSGTGPGGQSTVVTESTSETVSGSSAPTPTSESSTSVHIETSP